MLLSNEKTKREYGAEPMELSDIITKKTGMEDPFPDHVDTDEEFTPNNKTKKDDER